MNETTCPSGLAERVKGAAKRLAGTVTGNDTLRREGELHEKKAADLDAAAQLEAEAAQHEREGDFRKREQRLHTEQAELTTEAVVEAENDAIAQARREEGARNRRRRGAA